MRAVLVVVIEITSEQPLQMRFVDGNHVVQQFATATSYPSFRDPILPRTANRGPHSRDPHCANRDGNLGAILCVVIEEKKLGWGFVRKGLTQLLHNPGTGRMARYIEVENASPVVFQDKETVEYPESEGGHGEEVHGSKRFSVIAQERKPSLCGVWTARSTRHPSRHASLRNLASEHDEFTVNARRPPSRILRNHLEDQLADLLADGSPAQLLSCSGKMPPVKLKTSAVPPDHSIGRNHNQEVFPRKPEAPEPNPEQLVPGYQSGAAVFPLEHGQLLTKREIFDEQALPGVK
jgi:hypothetical protein